MTLIEIFSIIIIHFLGDFVLQTDKQAKGKSKNWADLIGHTIVYSCTWFLLPLILFCFNITVSHKIIYLIPITFICHTITDYFTSKLNKKLSPEEFTILLKTESDKPPIPFVNFPKGRNYHNFFISVGFDQILHYLQLFLTYYLLTKL